MTKHVAAGLILLATVGSAAAQDRKPVYTTPSPPSREVLDRLNLRMAWRGNVPMEGHRDGFVSIQINNGQVIALTRSGVVCAIDAETGRRLWMVTVGKAFDTNYAPAFNSRMVLVVSGVRLMALERATGAFLWEYRMPFAISAPPIADETKLFFSSPGGQVSAYELPSQDEIDTVRPRESSLRGDDYQGERRSSSAREIKPALIWSYGTQTRLEYVPALSGESLFFASPTGTVLSLPRRPIDQRLNVRYRFKLDRDLTVAPCIYDDTAYLATTDTFVVAVNMSTGKLQWRYPAGATVARPMFATETDIYISADNKGLVRLSRDDGHPLWKIPYGKGKTNAVALADRVIAVNDKFVYAADSGGRLMVLDRALGTQLSFYEPFRDYAFPVANQTTDRLILAANDGSVICLHDREYEKPLQHRKYELATGGGDVTKSMEEKLSRKVTEKSADAMALSDVLKLFRSRYGLDFFIDDRAFSAAALPAIHGKPVLQPKAEKMEIRDLLKNVLTQAGATFVVNRDVVWVVPAQKAGGGVGDIIPMPMADPADKAVLDILARKVDAPAVDKNTLSGMLMFMADRYNLNFDIDAAGFKTAGIENVLDKEVQAKGQKIALAQMLREMLAQVGGDYDVKGGKIVVRPAKK